MGGPGRAPSAPRGGPKAWRFNTIPPVALVVGAICLLPFLIPEANSAGYVVLTLVATGLFVLAVLRGWVPGALGLVYKGDGESGIAGVSLLLVGYLVIAAEGVLLRVVRHDLALVGAPRCSSPSTDYICHQHANLITLYAYAAVSIMVTGAVRYAVR